MSDSPEPIHNTDSVDDTDATDDTDSVDDTDATDDTDSVDDTATPPTPTAETAPAPGRHPLSHVGEHDIRPPHVVLTPVEQFDLFVDRLFDPLRGTEPADRIFYAITELADFSLIWLLIAAARGAASDKQVPNMARVTTVLLIESVLVNQGIKTVFRRERPVVVIDRPHKLRVPLTTSFPSGHSSAAAVAAILLGENSRAKPFYWALAGLVATSRIYVRIHHASDVVGGFAVGMTLGTVAKKGWPLEKGPVGTRRIRRRMRRGNAR